MRGDVASPHVCCWLFSLRNALNLHSAAVAPHVTMTKVIFSQTVSQVCRGLCMQDNSLNQQCPKTTCAELPCERSSNKRLQHSLLLCAAKPMSAGRHKHQSSPTVPRPAPMGGWGGGWGAPAARPPAACAGTPGAACATARGERCRSEAVSPHAYAAPRLVAVPVVHAAPHLIWVLQSHGEQVVHALHIEGRHLLHCRAHVAINVNRRQMACMMRQSNHDAPGGQLHGAPDCQP